MKYLIKNRQTDYHILLPFMPSDVERFAAQELVLFLDKATGCKLDIVTEQPGLLTYSHFISLGRNRYSENINARVFHEQLGEEGYCIETLNENIFIAGQTDAGMLNGVYRLLGELIGFDCLSVDEVDFKICDSIEFRDFNISDVPDFCSRAPGYYLLNNDEIYRRRMRVTSYQADWGLWAHTHFQILPPEIYAENHPDWYMTEPDKPHLNGKQLCYTRDSGDLKRKAPKGSMRAEFVKNLKKIVEQNPTKRYFMLGQQDIWTTCRCPSCQHSDDVYGGASGTMMRFVNAVAREMRRWLALKHPTRQNVVFCTFAYHMTQEPPVVIDESGQPVPIHRSVIAEENVAVMIAPIRACYFHGFDDSECNADYKRMFKGWSVVSNKIFLWNYCTMFSDYFYNLPNLDSMESNYRFFKKSGVYYFFDQAAVDDCNESAFTEMRIYVQSKLMWNTSLNVDMLCRQFIDKYYKQASAKITEYFDLIFGRYRDIEQERALRGEETHVHIFGFRNPYLFSKESFSYEFLEHCLTVFDEALAAAQTEPDPDLRTRLIKRINAERLSPLYILLELYRDRFRLEERKKLYKEFEKGCEENGFKRFCETWAPNTSFIRDKIEEWEKPVAEWQHISTRVVPNSDYIMDTTG